MSDGADGRERAMSSYFDRLLKDCKRPFHIDRRSLGRWTPIGYSAKERGLSDVLLVLFLLFFFLMMIFQEWLPLYILLAILIVIYIIRVALWTTDRREEEGRYRTGPGLIRKYGVSLADAVERVSIALDRGMVPSTVSGITLSDRPDRPRATIFLTDGSGIFITVWKDFNDPDFTIVHLFPHTRTNRHSMTIVKRLLDGHVPDP